MLIGLAGRAGAGKDTVAGIIREEAALAGQRTAVASFADPLYRAISAITGIPVAMLRDRTFKEDTIDWLGKSPRQLLQTLGTEWGRNMMGENFWVEIFRNAAEQYDTVVVSDVRFPNEVDVITEDMGGVVYRVVKANSGSNDQHLSEAGIDNLQVTGEVLNTALSAGDFQDEIFRLFHAGSENVH